MDQHIIDQILDTFVDVDLSIIKEVVYFDGWSTYEESGGYLIFIGIDDSIQRVEYGYCVMVSREDNINHFDPVDITAYERDRCIEEMVKTIDRCNDLYVD